MKLTEEMIERAERAYIDETVKIQLENQSGQLFNVLEQKRVLRAALKAAVAPLPEVDE